MKYLIFKKNPKDFKLKDGSILSALPCKEGFFILKSQLEDSELAGWVGGVESDSITQTETSTKI
tara:strand:- start:512 stop:703 length:192 start_codon:yes stop_codon:yes gene_type:complete